MFIELVDSLRCLGDHEDTWLVAGVTRMDGRHIVEGTLGCPVCRREYPIRNGAGWFAGGDVASAPPRLTPVPPDDDRVTRAAALLGLTEAGGIVVLGGAWTDCADALAELAPAHIVVLDRTASADSPQAVSSIVIGDRLPFAAGSVRAIALDDDHAATTLASAARALRSRGRLIGPAAAPVPGGVAELARDTQDWVGERAAVASAPVTIRSARR